MSFIGICSAPVPEIFWSEYLGKPFLKCIDCDVPLAEANAYIIQKVFVAGEAVFELAMCERCRNRMTLEYSEETKRNITDFMSTHFENRAADITDTPDVSALLHQCIEYCLICGIERLKCRRYSLAGVCRDDRILAQITPVSRSPQMVCEKCELGMAELVSQTTRESWERFIEEHFDGPPGVELDSPSSYPLSF